jgi:hypothetical protein
MRGRVDPRIGASRERARRHLAAHRVRRHPTPVLLLTYVAVNASTVTIAV